MNDEEKTIPKSFTETIQLVKQFAIKEIIKETNQKKLYYHTVDHAYAVERRALIIFQALELNQENFQGLKNIGRIKGLIQLSAITHDLVQEYIRSDELYAPRRRPLGLSEMTTINKLFAYINKLNQKLDSSVGFTKQDLKIISQAIRATICNYDSKQDSIYQPLLYQSRPKISVVARIIGLADLGALGMEGIEAYLRESGLIFLEENLDLVPLLLSNDLDSPTQLIALQNKEEIRKRLLKAARFLVNFAKGREARLHQEIQDFTAASRLILQNQVFKYLNPKTIQTIEEQTPTADNTTLAELLNYFQFPKYVAR
ncbi:hypothetical protein Sta7437_2030 [Stanieria cyanosphaera PCC 7437]|uniref:Uncharacterized protein n=1 Tax=Stanieria cyanosphaera (strain ATCC 29371 / PCC 7437) TaxID=111780 RepID=K9XVA8_STAC7|nr:hypothetical protein [Stanieria cyanosphaera]AFZ35582.1 hypothetical protein Sta7437_2030 [Stanieria cyanosphaera PCC 7437]